MVIIQVLDESCQCAIGVVDVRLVLTLCSIFHPETPRVSDKRYLMCSSFGVTGTLGLHDVGSSLGLPLQLHLVALEPLVEDGPGAQTSGL